MSYTREQESLNFNTDDDDIDDMPGIMRDHPKVDKQLCECVTEGCEGDALVRHRKDKKRFPAGPMCFQCRKTLLRKCEVCNDYCGEVYLCANPVEKHAMCKQFVGRRRHLFCGRYGCGHNVVVEEVL
jgi:hypothetical protein